MLAEARRRSNVREPITELIGREAVLDALEVALERDGRRWVTLRGELGIGKTRIALAHAASQPLAEFPGGVWVAGLERARSVADARRAISAALSASGAGLPARGGGAAIGRSLAARGRTLLVLDGATRIARELAPQLVSWLSAAPALRVIVTSEVRLGAPGESVLVVPPLEDAEAIALLRARARDARGRELSGGDASLAAIVRALDGSPLAIELLAARTAALSGRALLARIDDLLDAIAREGEGRPVAASIAAASAPARAILGALSLCRGEIAVEIAESLASGPRGGRALAIAELCDRSLLRAREGSEGEVLVVPALVRSHARRMLDRRRDAVRVRARWSETLLAIADRAIADLEAPGAISSLAAIRGDLETIAERAAPRDAARAAIAVGTLASLQGGVEGALALVGRALAVARALDADARQDLHHVRARLARRAGKPAEALADFRISHALAEDLGRPDRIARVAGDRADLLRHLGQLDEARALYRRALEIHTERGDLAGRGRTLSSLASMHHERGELDEARTLFAEAVAILASTSERMMLAITRQNLGLALQESGDLDGAERTFASAREEHRALGNRRFEAICELDLAGLALERGHARDALQRLERARTLATGSGDRRERGIASALLGACRAILGRVEGAEDALAEARGELRAVAEPALLDALDVHEGQIDLANALRARLAGDAAESERRLASVDARIARAEIARAGSDDVRFALRVLRRERARWEARARSVAIAADASWLIAPGGARVGLEERPLLRALLAALIAQHRTRPGVALPFEQLVRAGWPGERASESVHRNRLHVAIATLRALGLRDHLEGGRGGYRLELVEVHEPESGAR